MNANRKQTQERGPGGGTGTSPPQPGTTNIEIGMNPNPNYVSSAAVTPTTKDAVMGGFRSNAPGGHMPQQAGIGMSQRLHSHEINSVHSLITDSELRKELASLRNELDDFQGLRRI